MKMGNHSTGQVNGNRSGRQFQLVFKIRRVSPWNL